MDADQLMQLLRTFDVPLDTAAAKTAFADAGQAYDLAQWAAQHLMPETLLSRNEYEQYAALEQAGKVAELESSADLSTVRPLPDEELRDAISELNHSTEAIRKQSEILKQQQEALSRLTREAAKSADARVALRDRQEKVWGMVRTEAAASLEDVTERLDLKISGLEQDAKGAADAVRPLVKETLCADDKLLASLQKLGYEIQIDVPEEEEAKVTKLRDLCARSIKFEVEAIRTRLDRLFLEALQVQPHNQLVDVENRASRDDASVLEEEVESLYAEILPVAQMAAQQQFLDPATKSVARRSRLDKIHSNKAFEYIIACLDYLLDRTYRLSTRIEAFYAHGQATEQLISIAKEELAVHVSPSRPKHARRPTTSASSPPTRRRRSSGNPGTTSPVRLRAATMTRRRSSGGPGVPDELPLEGLLRGLAIALPQADDPSVAAHGGSIAAAQITALETVATDRTEKVANIARSVQDSFESSASTQLADVRRALMLVRDSILAESPSSHVQLSDPAIESSINFLLQEVQAGQTRLQGSVAVMSKARGRSIKRDELVSRWGKPQAR